MRTLVTVVDSLSGSPRDLSQLKPPSSYWGRVVFRIITSGTFETFIITSIVVNTLIMAMRFFGMSETYEQALETANTLFAVVFNLEAILKLYALKRQYFQGTTGSPCAEWALSDTRHLYADPWNRFDLVIVVGTDLGLLFTLLLGADLGAVATVVRAFRIGRILRLIQRAKRLRMLFQTLLVTLPSLGNIGSLLFLLYFIYAIMGVQLFAHVKWGVNLNQHAHFRSFGAALLTLVGYFRWSSV